MRPPAISRTAGRAAGPHQGDSGLRTAKPTSRCVPAPTAERRGSAPLPSSPLAASRSSRDASSDPERLNHTSKGHPAAPCAPVPGGLAAPVRQPPIQASTISRCSTAGSGGRKPSAAVTVKRQYDTSRRRAAAQATRQAILDAATRLFAERGYAATTMAQLA
ncbi:helix-turn-helix domain-containing protein, partial [Streptomyces sp. NPDC060027]|uniref:helix-turn-helix domain-containing protein n=1 Tax=Streptomyces sp. NPDC060027 TaxID=3347040 RepID=UPI0036C40C3F